MEIYSGDRDKIIYLHRTPLFDRCLDNLRKRKGTASMAAKKVDEFVGALTQQKVWRERKKFGFTWNGEYRIKNCKKIDLVGGYRLICIKKDRHLVLLYVGSHDECFRWIERNKGLTYGVDRATDPVSVLHDGSRQVCSLPEDVLEEQKYIEEYEDKLMKRIDENVLCKIFPGFHKKD
ncbi:MAG: hypothetical protein AB1632_14530 [Nitrospirota bacterium]